LRALFFKRVIAGIAGFDNRNLLFVVASYQSDKAWLAENVVGLPHNNSGSVAHSSPLSSTVRN
jgi:hypothetical protein